MTLDEMLKVAFRLGKGETMRGIGDSLNRSPTTVYNIKKRVVPDREYFEMTDKDGSFHGPAALAAFTGGNRVGRHH